MSQLKEAILRTLAYADVFDYPLTSEELYRFLIADEPLSHCSLKRVLIRIGAIEKRIDTNRNYFFLRNRQETTTIRERRKRWSREKLKIARRMTQWLRLIPWVKMVAVTGALAMENSDKDDDLDLLIITAENRLWLSRGLIVILLRFLGLYRRPEKIKDMICPNMFLDEGHLCLPRKEQNLFTAHEVCQLRSLWDKGEIYEKFIEENGWVEGYLPNALRTKERRNPGTIRHGAGKRTKEPRYHTARGRQKSFSVSRSFSSLVDLFEYLAYRAQLAYMKSRRTTEVTKLHRIRFHPEDCREWVLREYQKKLESLRGEVNLNFSKDLSKI